MAKILLIEDEQNVANFIKQGLEEDGYEVFHTNNGIDGIELLYKQNIDLVLLDILLPKINGLEVCKKIKTENSKQVSILMLTALDTPENVALGLDSGADDYLSKPFKFIELKARIRNLLRRKELLPNEISGTCQVYRFIDIELNDSTKRVSRNDIEISLTSTEYKLLLTFMKKPNIVLSRNTLLEEVWGIDFDNGTNVVDVYVNYLRKKLNLTEKSRFIQTVIGMGYVLREDK